MPSLVEWLADDSRLKVPKVGQTAHIANKCIANISSARMEGEEKKRMESHAAIAGHLKWSWTILITLRLYLITEAKFSCIQDIIKEMQYSRLLRVPSLVCCQWKS